jgi:hypothetical protein
MTALASSPRFLRVAAVCWMVTGITTLGLIFLPRLLPAAPDLAARAALAAHPIGITRAWVGVVHPLFAILAALGVGAALVHRAPGRATIGALAFAVWALTELVQQSLLLVGLRWTLYPGYLAAAPADQPAIAASIAAVQGVSDALFFVLLIAFVVAHVLYAWAMPKASGLDRVVATIFVLAAGLGVISFLTSFGRGVMPAAVMDVLYPLIQPAGRALTGVWLWRRAFAAG